MVISCYDLTPRGSRQCLAFTVWKSAVQTESQAGRLGTPRLQACLDRSSPVSDCCGLVLGVEGSATLLGGCCSAAVPQTMDAAAWEHMLPSGTP